MEHELVIATIVLSIETLIIIGLNMAVIEARRLRTWWHHFWIYTIYVVQGIVWGSWMAPKGIRGITAVITGQTNIAFIPFRVVLHWIVGLTVVLSATTLVVTFLVFPSITVSKMRRAKPLMRYVYVSWSINYLIGIWIYLAKYILN